ncbi:Mov34/MPN/PAD-1 family protein [Zychaea mexicana]|uniref:Mov34/MPN/PAD-1 family protein n=1 Tax=Zychaea mexicana TaxID=64656 RepID=UPI0022FEAA4E|nr:Mov34/MPN/PAD-1 family protein [Zychaea mexicana]KAI9490782.1 Mov34/MPN/PAD-1 family protein [Zychaea mexicana]
MDIEEDQRPAETTGSSTPVIVSAAQASSGLSISIHPLVLLNISDHYTRLKLQDPAIAEAGRIYGAILAQQSGRDIDIINSFELPMPQQDKVDLDYLAMKQEQLKQVFPHLDFMGWYSLGNMPSESDLKIHEQLLQVNESSIYLQLDPAGIAGGTKEFPVKIYESTMDMIDEQARLVFVKAPYKIETNEAERVAVDHVAKPSTSSREAMISHLTTQRNAIAMLHARIQFLHQYLKDAKEGKIPLDHDIVRQISSVCQRSPLMNSNAFDEQLSVELDDVLLVAYLTTITKGMNTMNDLIDKFNLAHGTIQSTGTRDQAGMMPGKAGLASPAGGRRRMMVNSVLYINSS